VFNLRSIYVKTHALYTRDNLSRTKFTFNSILAKTIYLRTYSDSSAIAIVTSSLLENFRESQYRNIDTIEVFILKYIDSRSDIPTFPCKCNCFSRCTLAIRSFGSLFPTRYSNNRNERCTANFSSHASFNKASRLRYRTGGSGGSISSRRRALT